MGMSRSARIILLLVIDVVFFFIELIVGYAVGSLALIADSFHMLNDVMSLIVALYAIKLTNSSSKDSRYSYGWHRAEILAALINGVFLLALCFSISLEAIQRFFSTPDISNPKLVAIVGSFGLASNIVGLFLFREHGHAHEHTRETAPPVSKSQSVTSSSAPIPRDRSSSRTPSHSSEESYSLYGHPAAARAFLVQTAADIASGHSPSSANHPDTSPLGVLGQSDHTPTASEHTPLLEHQQQDDNSPCRPTHHGHSHGGSMNMRALVLHVIGDALGNVGVISTGLVIWLTSWSFKYYFDPFISLVITIIIFSSAMPLVRSTSFILLQGVPSTISLDEVRDAILNVDGVLSVHELHVWQLSETKIVASVHVMASRNHDFMPIAAKIREILHHTGIHSSTIQPEYYHPATGLPDEQLKTGEETSCLILCPPDEACDSLENACCPPIVADA